MNCKKQKTKPKGYHFTECGLDYVYLINGYEIEKDSDGEELITINNAGKLHRAIARSVLLYKEKLEGQEIRFFRSLLRLTQEQLGNLLDMSRENIARWENGKHPPSSQASNLLRIIVWEEYLNEDKAVKFYKEHKKEMKHYKIMEMMDKNDEWELKKAA